MRYRSELDAIRGIAVLIVLFQHFGLVGVGEDNHRAGQVGVTLFFALSGYLITGLLLAEHAETGRVSLVRFYIRRARRLWPALIAMVAVVYIAGLPGHPLFPLTYTSNIVMQAGVDPGAYQHTWTLGIEEQFYLLWPVAFLVLARWPRVMVAVLVGVIVLSVLARPYTGLLQRNDALLGGALLAILRIRAPWWIGLAGWIGVVATAFVPGPTTNEWLTLATIASVMVVAAPGPIDKARSLVRLGAISYGVYLWSFPIALTVQPVFARVPPVEAVAWAMGGLTATLIAAMVSERFVERRWRVRRPDMEKPPVAEATGDVVAEPARS